MTVYSCPKPAPKVKQPRPLARKRMKRRPKSAATWARQYHSAEFVAFVQARPCAVCGVLGYSVAAHTKGIEKKGAGQKTSWRTLAPMCAARPATLLVGGQHLPMQAGIYPGCHDRYDADSAFRARHAQSIRVAIAALQSAFQDTIEQQRASLVFTEGARND